MAMKPKTPKVAKVAKGAPTPGAAVNVPKVKMPRGGKRGK